MKWHRTSKEIKNERCKAAPEIHIKKATKKEKDVIKTETLSAYIIESKKDAIVKLNNEMNCQEGAIAMTTTAATTTINKPNAYFSFSEVPVVLNANQLASVLNISLTNAYCLLRSENFPTLRIGRRLLVSRDNLLNWMNENSLAS